MLEQITPIILTYNEAPNIARTLEKLSWAKEILVIDSFSNDATLEILSHFPAVRCVQRRFDSFADQWNFALEQGNLKTPWVLALDADYQLTPEAVSEIQNLQPPAHVAGYQARFQYGVFGKRLRGSLYPPVSVLFRRQQAHYKQDGHAHRVVLGGVVEMLQAYFVHDDRKPLARWYESQLKYTEEEAQKISRSSWRELKIQDRLRKAILPAPFLVLIYCLIVKGLILDGWPGIYYTWQRFFAELFLSLKLLDQKIRKENDEAR